MASSESGAAPHRFNFAAAVSVGLLLIVWQVASFFLPEFIVPGLHLIVLEFVKMFEEGTLVSDSLLTLVRVMLGAHRWFYFRWGFGSAHGTGEKERRLFDAGDKFRHGSASVILDTDRDSLVSRHRNAHLRVDVGGVVPGLRAQHSRCGQRRLA
jgi:hypothetical protein